MSQTNESNVLLLLAGCFKQAVTALGNIDIVFNNAGLVMENRWEYMIDVNIVSYPRPR